VTVKSLTAKQSAAAPTDIDFSKRATYNLLITPGLAAWILENKNGSNLRKTMVRAHVRLLGDTMARGDWVDNHVQPIIFDENGDLADGQHRMQCVVDTGKSIWMKVEAGCPDAWSKTYDTVQPRGLKDHAPFSNDPKLNGYMATIVRQYQTLLTGNGRTQPTSIYEALYLEHADAINFAALFASSRVKAVTRAGVSCALLEMFERGRAQSKAFAESLRVPDGPIQPARMLRDWCQRNSSSGGGTTGTRHWFDRSVFCMNAFFEGRDITQVKPGIWGVKKK
jgi:hypothetical protein